ncbi:MAG: AsmA family protein [Terracidiphilus sp.]|jgi:hypothetical protein
MTNDEQPRQRNHKRLWLALAALVVLLTILIVPPYVSVSRYKSRITQLISASLGRPVRLSSVEVRLLPRPGFLLTNLTVDEDPAYGAEPVLHAETVAASIRLLSLWRGRIELDTISVDNASLNLVRTPVGRWNLDSLLRTATSQAQSASGGAEANNQNKPIRLPYFEATNSRINIKSGTEKLPFSLLNADLSFWQQNPGEWRVRLRAQPARTDLSLEQADTGVVRLEASLHQASQLRQMPVNVDLEWREAQLGQLTRLLLGSDAGWRGDLTGQFHLEGTAEAAQIKTRLRAIGVHRAEFAPAAPMDFDANCTLVAHFSARVIDNLLCDSPLGSGHVRLTGDLPGQTGQPHFSLELDRIPVAVGLDALRAVRSGLSPALEAAGSASGTIIYAPAAPDATFAKNPDRPGRKPHPAVQGPLTGNLIVDDFQLGGNGLGQPIRVPKILLEPAPPSQTPGTSQALAATVVIPAGAAVPLAISARLSLSGYQFSVRGQASIVRAREFAHIAGLANAATLDALAGDPVSMDLTAEGPWMPTQPLIRPSVQSPLSSPGIAPPADTLTGTVTLRNSNWKADYLTNAVMISQATLHLASGQLRWDPVVFSYGPVKGTASLTLPAVCDSPQTCAPHFQLQFGALDAGVLQVAFLGAHEKGTLLSTLIERLRPTVAPAWPLMEGTVKAESLVLGPVILHEPSATVSTLANGAEISAFDASLFGGHVHGTGKYQAALTAKDKPSYVLEGRLEKLNSKAIGQLVGLRAAGSGFDGNGKIELAGFTGNDLAASAKGNLHFEWQRGTVAGPSGFVPAELARFDRWIADAEISNGALTLKENQVKRGTSSTAVEASVTLTDPPKIAFPASKPTSAKR